MSKVMDRADMADKQIEDRLIMALAHRTKGKESSSPAGYSITCEECGEPTQAQRHKILPDCATCVDCANLLEQANRNWGTWWV